jgi:Icc-related predicted phosphoesterase
MRRLVLCAGLHGHPEALGWLRRLVEARRPDGLLFAGGILHPARRCAAKETPWSLAAEDTAFAKQFFTALSGLGVFCAAIPGPAGEPQDEFFRLALEAELAFPNVHVAHATLVAEGDVAVCGLGGDIAEGRLIGCESYTRPAAEYFLRPLWRAEQPRKVLLLSAPPPGPLGGPEGNALVGDLIDSLHPDLCVVAGASERRGGQRVAHTHVVNPGRLADGWAAWLDWGQAEGSRLELLNLKG